MKQVFFILSFFVLNSFIQAQDARDNVIGTYPVHRQADGSGPIYWDTLIVSKHLSDTAQIYILYPSVGGGYYYIFDSTNGSFYEPNLPSLLYGGFFSNDSIFSHRHLFNSSAPFYYEYWGFKLTVGINEVNVEDKFSVYPNPTNGVLHIQTKKTTGKVAIQLFDVMGKTAYSTTVLANNEQVVTINTTNFAKGIYFLLLEDEKNSTVKKVVVR